MSTEPPKDDAPTSILSLPSELVSHITLFLPRNDTISLGRAIRGFNSYILPALWSQLDLSLQGDFAATPSTGTTATTSASEAEHRRALRNHVNTIISRGTERTWAHVKSISLETRPASAPAMVKLLELASPYVQTLNVEAPFNCDRFRPRDSARLEYVWAEVGQNIHFANLTSIRLAWGTIRYAGFLALILDAAPGLTTLDAAYAESYGTAGGDLPITFPSLERNHLQNLRVTFDEEFSEDHEAPLVELLKHSPGLEKLSITFSNQPRPLGTGVALAVSRLEKLVFVSCYADTYIWLGGDSAGFTSLRTMVLPIESGKEVISRILPTIPSLQILHVSFDQAEPDLELTITPYPPASSCQPIDANLVTRIKRLPLLSYLRNTNEQEEQADVVDIWEEPSHYEKPDGFTGVIRSVCHGGSELIHLRLLLEEIVVERADVLARHNITDRPLTKRILHVAGDGNPSPYIASRSPPVWQDFSDLDGKMVPMVAMDRMWAVDGAGIEGWKGRGLEVSEKAWQVVEDWKSSADGS